MKKILLPFIILVFMMSAKAQDGELLSYWCVTDMPESGKTELYNRAKEWVKKELGYSDEIILENNANERRITAKGVLRYFQKAPIMYGWNVAINYIVIIETKDKKYRCTITEFNHSATWNVNADVEPMDLGIIKTTPPETNRKGVRSMIRKTHDLALQKIDEKANELINSLNDFMSNNTEKVEDDW